MAKYDLETVLSDISSVVTSNIAAKISAINSEKNDSITLKDLDSNAVAIQSMDGKVLNYNPFLYVGIVNLDGEASPREAATLQKWDVAVLMVLSDEAQDVEIYKKMFRYQRVLQEIFEENFESLSGYSKLKVKSQTPIELALVNNSYSHKAIGVMVSGEIG